MQSFYADILALNLLDPFIFNFIILLFISRMLTDVQCNQARADRFSKKIYIPRWKIIRIE